MKWENFSRFFASKRSLLTLYQELIGHDVHLIKGYFVFVVVVVAVVAVVADGVGVVVSILDSITLVEL